MGLRVGFNLIFWGANPMEHITSVALIYHNRNRKIFQHNAEFLRLMGMYVCEKVLFEDTDVKMDNYIQEIGCSAYYKIHGNETENGEDEILFFLKDNLKSQFEETNFFTPYDSIKKIFTNHQLLQASVTLQYFRTKAEAPSMKKELKEVSEKFEKAADDLVNLIKDHNDYMNNFYVRYARLYCKQKANLASNLSDDSVVYYINDLAAEALALIDDFPDFSNAWVLLGFVYEISEKHTYEAIMAFKHAIEMEGNKKYISSVYYWLGKRYEELDSLKQEASNCFKRAYQIMPKYRNTYKMAAAYMYEGSWDEAIKFFEECISYIEGREELWDPLEQEYYFKIKVHLGFIYLQKEEYPKAIQCSEEAISFEKEFKEFREKYTKFYTQIYDRDKVDIIANLTLEKLSKKRTYAYLLKAYEKIGNAEKAREYVRLLSE